MKTKLLITMLLAAGLVSACSEMNPHPMDMSQAVQSAASKADHEALAKHYEDAANEMQVKVDEHKKLLAEYQLKSYLYGRQAEDLKAHCLELITIYEKAVVSNRKMAEMHQAVAH
jgi:ABC-type Fe3+-citrate transport system substrate-binding protein